MSKLAASTPNAPFRAGRPARGAKPSEVEDVRIGARNRLTILRAATVQFARRGFDGTTIESIASEAKLPRANVYYYYSSKEDIYRTILGDLIAGWDAALDRIDPDAEPAEALAAYVTAKLDHARRNAAESRLFALEILGGAPFLTRAERDHMREATRAGAGTIEGWIAAGKLKPVDPRHLLILLWSATQFYADFAILAADALDRPQLSRRDFDAAGKAIADIVLRGLAAEQPAHDGGSGDRC